MVPATLTSTGRVLARSASADSLGRSRSPAVASRNNGVELWRCKGTWARGGQRAAETAVCKKGNRHYVLLESLRMSEGSRGRQPRARGNIQVVYPTV